eukprot:gene9589-biopygen1546
MRIGCWSSAAGLEGLWQRVSTAAVSNQSFPMIQFSQQCNQDYCPWHGATSSEFSYVATHHCDTSDLHASPWAPFPVYDHEEDRWAILYGCDFTQLVTAGSGNIFVTLSETHGVQGISGPWGPPSIVLGPNGTGGARWGTAARGPQYVDSINPFILPNGTYAAFVGEGHYLAVAASPAGAFPAGPWHVGSSPIPLSSPGSKYVENPVVVNVPDMTWRVVLALYMCRCSLPCPPPNPIKSGFGLSFSNNGLSWLPGVDVYVPGGTRTPLGLIEQVARLGWDVAVLVCFPGDIV